MFFSLTDIQQRKTIKGLIIRCDSEFKCLKWEGKARVLQQEGKCKGAGPWAMTLTRTWFVFRFWTQINCSVRSSKSINIEYELYRIVSITNQGLITSPWLQNEPMETRLRDKTRQCSRKRLFASIPHLFGFFPMCLVCECTLGGYKIFIEWTSRVWQL